MPIQECLRVRWSSGAGPRAALALAALLISLPVAAASPHLSLEGMTLVLARHDRSELVLTAARATLEAKTTIAHLRDVRVVVAEGPSRTRFEARCPGGRLDLASQDFEAEGAVVGNTGDGRRFRAESLRYRHDERRFESDDLVSIEDGTGRIDAGGFRYSLADRRFRLLAGSHVVAAP